MRSRISFFSMITCLSATSSQGPAAQFAPEALASTTQKIDAMLLPMMSPLLHTRSGPKDDAAETAQGKCEVDAADRGHRDELRPDDGEISAAIKDGLREGDEMWGRADDPHHVLQPDRHALHRSGAAGQKLHDKEDRSREQRELAHSGRDRAKQNAERGDCESVKRGSKEKEGQGAGDGNLEQPLDHERKRQSGGEQDDKAVGDNL